MHDALPPLFTDALGKVDVTASYDDLYQLTEETGVQNHVYTNDSISNRRSKNGSSYTLDNTNKLLTDANDAFVYGKNGNLFEHATPTKTTKFTYDALDRLIQVSDGTQEVRYYYDNFHKRIARSINGKPLEYFLYLGQREVGLWSGHQLKEYRVLGLGKGAELGASVALELDGVTYCPLHDHRGNIIALVDAQTGYIAESYRYTAFGECETYNHKQQQIEKTAVSNPWGYASKRLDPETGFVYFSRCYYAPTTGRWITPDPLGFADGPNMYAYVHGNPMTHFDLYGLMCVLLPFESDDDEDGLTVLNNLYCDFFERPWDSDYWAERNAKFAENLPDMVHSMGMPVGHAASKVATEAQGLFGKIVRYFGLSREAVPATKQMVNGMVGGLEGVSTQRLASDVKRMVDTHSNLKNPTHPCFKNWINLNKSIANQQHMKETGSVIAGRGSRDVFRDAPLKAKEYGGSPDDWVKKSSSFYKALDGKEIEMHWIENTRSGQREEFKSIFDRKLKNKIESEKGSLWKP